VHRTARSRRIHHHTPPRHVLEEPDATGNVFGYSLCMREAVRRMSTRHGGRGGVIVNVSSGPASHETPGIDDRAQCRLVDSSRPPSFP